MIEGISASLSALGAFTKKVAVVANNVANMSTDGFKKSRAILNEGEHTAVDVLIREIDAPGTPKPQEPGSNAPPEETSNVDLAEEMIHLTMAQRGYEANLKSLKAQNELKGTVLDILK